MIANEKIVQISLGGYHSSALTSEGRLFTWGSNEYFQLGEDTQIDKSLPLDVTSQFNLTAGEMIIQVSLGFRHSSALTSEGRIFTWGSDKFGQLGDGTATRIYRPLEITSKFSLNESETITKLSLGGNHSSLLTSEGRIFIWGSNEDGQLGDGTQLNQSIPKEITSQFELNESETIIQVFLGGNHSSLFTSEGRIFTWGDNHYYQLGDSTQVNKSIPQEITSQFNLNESETIIQISLGNDHSSLFTSEGRIFTWGHNQYGLNNDTMNRTFRPL